MSWEAKGSRGGRLPLHEMLAKSYATQYSPQRRQMVLSMGFALADRFIAVCFDSSCRCVLYIAQSREVILRKRINLPSRLCETQTRLSHSPFRELNEQPHRCSVPANMRRYLPACLRSNTSTPMRCDSVQCSGVQRSAACRRFGHKIKRAGSSLEKCGARCRSESYSTLHGAGSRVRASEKKGSHGQACLASPRRSGL